MTSQSTNGELALTQDKIPDYIVLYIFPGIYCISHTFSISGKLILT